MHNIRQLLHGFYKRFFLKASTGSIRIGLIGIGGWGAVNASNIMRSARYTIQGVYDIQETPARKFASRYRTVYYKNLSDLLADTAVEAVCITVPNPLHKELVIAAADAGKHIFIEKPLASDHNECRYLGQYCETKQVILQVGHQMRREPVFREIKRHIREETLGRPIFAQGVYTLDRSQRKDWRRNVNSCPGGSMEQLGIHLIDILIFLLGSPEKACGWTNGNSSCSNKFDWRSLIITFSENIRANVSASFSCPKYLRLELFFEQGWLSTDGRLLLYRNKKEKTKTYRPSGQNGSVSQFIEFADCIEKGLVPETGAPQAEMVMKLVQSTYYKAKRRPINHDLPKQNS